MLEEIDMLREKLDEQVLKNAPYEDILFTSKEIDYLLIKYYSDMDNFKKAI